MYSNNLSGFLQGMMTRRRDGRHLANRGSNAARVNIENDLV